MLETVKVTTREIRAKLNSPTITDATITSASRLSPLDCFTVLTSSVHVIRQTFAE